MKPFALPKDSDLLNKLLSTEQQSALRISGFESSGSEQLKARPITVSGISLATVTPSGISLRGLRSAALSEPFESFLETDSALGSKVIATDRGMSPPLPGYCLFFVMVIWLSGSQ